MSYRILLTHLFCLILFSCSNNKNPYPNNLDIEPSLAAQIDTAHYTFIRWQDSIIDFGTIKMGDSVHFKFRFTNAGSTPLFILQARPGCGCTVTNFPKDPVMPGKASFISATLKSGFHTGEINKSITVVSNTKKHTKSILIMRGVIQSSDNKIQE